MTSATFDAAREYLSRGWSVFPVLSKKQPVLPWEQLQGARLDEHELRRLYELHPEAGVACALGAVSGVVRLDIDSDEAAAEAHRRYGELSTLAFSTPSGGLGYLFKHADLAETAVLWKGSTPHSELRLLSDGRYTVLPPTAGYEWLNSEPIAKLPAVLADELLAVRAERALRELEAQLAPTVADPGRTLVLEALKALDPVRCDDRDSWLQVGMALHSAGDQYLEPWVEWSRNSDKFVDGECEKLWAGFSRSGRVTVRTLLFLAKQDGWEAPSLHEPLTDVGNGRTLARSCAGKALYCQQWDKWLWWAGTHWRVDAEFQVIAQQKQIVRERQLRAVRSIATMEGDEEAKRRKIAGIGKVVSWCTVSESAARVHAAIDMARSELGILVDVAELEPTRHIWLLNCANGVIDLRTGSLSPHDPDLYITQLCPTEYHPEALCPRFDQFLVEVFEGKLELIGWLQRLLGYCLTADTSEHCLPIFYGGGRNGKSTLVKTAMRVLGNDYSGTTPSGFLAHNKSEQHPTKLVELYGRRLVVDLETSDGMRLNEELVKRITGGDELKARRMREDFWPFQPTHKLLLATNYEPKVKGFDVAIWSRLKKVPFLATFEGDARDPHLDEKLAVEAPGILAWMVRGCLEWQRTGLADVEEVRLATEQYKMEQDTVQQFVAERVDRSPGHKLRKVDAAAAYRAWCAANSVEPVSAKQFGVSVAKLGVASDETGKFYVDVKV